MKEMIYDIMIENVVAITTFMDVVVITTFAIVDLVAVTTFVIM